MSDSEEVAPVGKSRLPGVSKWFAIAGLALLLFFVITAFINRNQLLDQISQPQGLAAIQMNVSFAQSIGVAFANTLGGACGAVFIASSLCTAAALVTGVASLRAASPPDPRAKIGLALATAGMALTAVVAICLSLAMHISLNIINLVR